ncbi:uncharacterized protein LOC107964417 [Apis mellifera]|uniref:Uncharacterized protein LOC107964417 n=1 Tax=Apis mellifera TaxID=7460 RepID=A0A7M7L286_APIME|nr:uncharacterized protein LOC107964417 [Apis mellifera]|eukprot:XP_026296657.1 uncharacterized protein LOC107964417 [Apis mellifera]
MRYTHAYKKPTTPMCIRDMPPSYHADQTYIISKKAEAILSTVLIDILEESLEDARNLAVTAGKHSVTHKEMERSLRNLCLRLSTVPAYNARIGPRNNDEDKDSGNSFKVCRKEKD